MFKKHLMSRGFNPDEYHCWFSEDTLTVPLYCPNTGKFLGEQSYKPTSKRKYSTHSTTYAFWGWETVPENYSGICFITESVFKAVALHNIGFVSIAALGVNLPKGVKDLLPNKNSVKYFLIGDNDVQGKRESKRFNGFELVSPIDLDEMTDKDKLDFIRSNLEYFK